jgi:crossover junction endodeoxyribonuclease RuvC
LSNRILGIDPGLTRCGAGIIELSNARKVSFVEVHTFRSSPEIDLAARVGSIASSIEQLIVSHKPSVLAIERVFSQSNVRSVMGTAQISGAVLFLAHKHSIPVALHTPTEVKAAVTGSGRADKAQVGFMVAKILGLAEVPKPADAADSLAIAICHAWRSFDANVQSGAVGTTAAQAAWHAAIKSASKNK